ncbi:hypothetical protein [Agrobacterium pusense]
MIKSLITKDSFTAQTRRGWMPDLVRHDGGEVFEPGVTRKLEDDPNPDG